MGASPRFGDTLKLIRFFFTLIVLATLCVGVFWLFDTYPDFKEKVLEKLPKPSCIAFEKRFSSEQILDNERFSLLSHQKLKQSQITLKFYPLLLMEVKFTSPDHSTHEGVILWDLIDGEMVIDADSWKKTHGFADCIQAHTNRYEYQIIKAIIENHNQIHREVLNQLVNIDPLLIEKWLKRCVKKKLVVCHKKTYRVHIQNPRFSFVPMTKIAMPLATRNYRNVERSKKYFSSVQIIQTAKAAFGNDFAIRRSYDVHLPIYSFSMQNRDGSIQIVYYNALNGQRFFPSGLSG